MAVYLLLSLSLQKNISAQTTLSDTLIINELIEIADSIMVNEPKNAKILVDSAMVIAEKLGLEDFEAKCLQRKVYYNYYQGQLSKTIDCLLKLLPYFESKNDTAKIVKCYGEIGITYVDKMEYTLSLEYLFKAMKMGEYIDDTEQKAMTFTNLGYTYLLMRNYTDAHKYTNKSLNLFTEINYKEGIANANSTIGRIFTNEENYDSALTHFELALVLFEEIDQQNSIAGIYKFLGDIKSKTKEYKEAIKYYTQSADFFEQLGNTQNYLYALNNIAKTNNLLGNYSKSISIYEDALSKANEEDDKMVIIKLLSSVNKVYATTGNYQKAHETLTKYSLMKDEVFNTEKSEQIEELKIEFETEQKEAEIKNLKDVTELQNKSLEQRQMIIFLLIGSLALIGLLGYFGISRYRMKTQQNSMELEQRLLRSQMNPHFIFNSLSVIQGYIFKGSAKEAASYLSNFGKLMRNILENSREEYVMLDKELETLNHYLELQNLRHGGKINYTIGISENLPSDSVSVPPMLAQPFIENSIKHGMNENGEVSIMVKYQKSNDKMKLIIEDDGIGINKSQNINAKLDKHKSLSTSITEGRLQLLSKRAKSKYKLSIVDIGDKDIKKSGTRVEVELPYLEEF